MLLHCRVVNILDCLFNYTASPCLTPTYRTVLRLWTIWKVPLQGIGPTQQRIQRTVHCVNGDGTWATWSCFKRFGCFRLLLEVSQIATSDSTHSESSRVCVNEPLRLLLCAHQSSCNKTFPRAAHLLQCQYKPVKQYIPLLSQTHTDRLCTHFKFTS